MKWTNGSAGKIQCKRFNDKWSQLGREHRTWTELTGVIGQSEYSSTLSTLGSPGNRPDVAQAQEAIGNLYNWTLTAANAASVATDIEKALEQLKTTRPVVDKRKSPEQNATETAERDAMTAARDEKARQETARFLALYGSGETVTVQPGQMAVTAQICYDDSDSMTDYFNPHVGLSPEFALLVVPKQAETERLARRALAVAYAAGTISQPDFGFEWKTEKYSMGHGNYLTSDGFDLPEDLRGIRPRADGSQLTRAHWEIEFTHTYQTAITLPAFRGYGTVADPEPVESSEGVTLTENTARGGIELRFPGKPSAEVLDRLKAYGWRWSRFSNCWYKRASDDARAFARTFLPPEEKLVDHETSPAPTPGA